MAFIAKTKTDRMKLARLPAARVKTTTLACGHVTHDDPTVSFPTRTSRNLFQCPDGCGLRRAA